MKIKIENIEIRGIEVKPAKKGGEVMIVTFEDETGRQHTITDYDMDRRPYYKRGTVGDIYADFAHGWTRDGKEYYRLEVKEFKAENGDAC